MMKRISLVFFCSFLTFFNHIMYSADAVRGVYERAQAAIMAVPRIFKQKMQGLSNNAQQLQKSILCVQSTLGCTAQQAQQLQNILKNLNLSLMPLLTTTRFSTSAKALQDKIKELQTQIPTLPRLTPEKKVQLIAVAKKVAIAAAAMAVAAAAAVAVGIVSKKMSEEEEKPMEFTRRQGESIPSIELLARQFDISTIPQDDSPASRFIHAIRNKVIKVISTLTDLVPKNFLQLGKEIARLSHEATQSIQEKQTYKEIETIVDQALALYDDATLHKNQQFIYAVTTGLDAEVRARMCDPHLKPTTNAIQEALAVIERKTGPQFRDITNFIKNPMCGE